MLLQTTEGAYVAILNIGVECMASPCLSFPVSLDDVTSLIGKTSFATV